MNKTIVIASMAAALVVSLTLNVAQADDLVIKGEQLFKKNCATCHAMPSENKHMFGPSLHGVVGRNSGTAPGYAYSDAMKSIKVVWTENNLGDYLKNPDQYVEHITYSGRHFIKMAFQGFADEADRKAVIAFLKAN